jgi:UDP-N-acetylmuramate--alanine ligase
MGTTIELHGTEHIHLIGIGGAGLSAIAGLLLERGHPVSGSDLRDSAILHDLERRGATVYTGHDPARIASADLVVASSAVPPEDPELREARDLGRPVLHRGAMLRLLAAGRQCLAVAGTHGKTTTSAMLALLLRAAGRDPSFIVGGEVPALGSSGHAGQGPHFVLEADEYDRTFLALHPTLAIVTNVEWDHVDCYPDPAAGHAVFAQFIGLVPPEGAVLLCQDDPGAWSLPRPAAPTWGYGLDPAAWWRAVDVVTTPAETTFGVVQGDRSHGTFSLHVPGEHNVRNALAALAAAAWTGVDIRAAGPALSTFHGVYRRFTVLGTAGGVTFVDDYAHHPSEIRATLAAARQRFPDRRLVAVLQPHTYSRARALGAEMARALAAADLVLVTGVYAAREPDPGDVSGAQIAAAVDRPAGYAATLEASFHWLQARLQPDDVVLTLGAGDITTLGPRLLAAREAGGKSRVVIEA